MLSTRGNGVGQAELTDVAVGSAARGAVGVVDIQGLILSTTHNMLENQPAKNSIEEPSKLLLKTAFMKFTTC